MDHPDKYHSRHLKPLPSSRPYLVHTGHPISYYELMQLGMEQRSALQSQMSDSEKTRLLLETIFTPMPGEEDDA